MSVLQTLEDETSYYIVSELLMGGDLMGRLKKCLKFKESDARHIIRQILLSINYLHNKNMTHRDLKLENILMASTDP